MQIYTELKKETYNCLSIVTKKRTLDLEIHKPKNLLSTLVVFNSLISISYENVISNAPYTKSFFVFKRLRMFIKYECMQKDVTINELWLVAFIKYICQQIAKETDKEKIEQLEIDRFKLYKMLMVRFDLGGKIIKCIRKINQISAYEAQLVKNQAFNQQVYLTQQKLNAQTLAIKKEQFRIEGLQYKKNLKLLQRMIELKQKHKKEVSQQEITMKQTAKFLEKQLAKQLNDIKGGGNQSNLNYEISRFNILSKAVKLENPLLKVKYKTNTLNDFMKKAIPQFVFGKQFNQENTSNTKIQKSNNRAKTVSVNTFNAMQKLQLENTKSEKIVNQQLYTE